MTFLHFWIDAKAPDINGKLAVCGFKNLAESSRHSFIEKFLSLASIGKQPDSLQLKLQVEKKIRRLLTYYSENVFQSEKTKYEHETSIFSNSYPINCK